MRGWLLASVVLSGAFLAACSSPAAQPGSTAAGNSTPAELINTGLAALKAGNDSTARSDFTQVIAIDPQNKAGDNKIAYFDLGVIDQQQRNIAGSEAEYQEALNIDPNYVLANYNLGVEEAVSNPTYAISLYRTAVAAQPTYVEAVYNLGLLLYQQGQVAEGQTYLAKAIAMDPSYRNLLPAGVVP
jgi:tetratricopeptide (TPR) repeat protein